VGRVGEGVEACTRLRHPSLVLRTNYRTALGQLRVARARLIPPRQGEGTGRINQLVGVFAHLVRRADSIRVYSRNSRQKNSSLLCSLAPWRASTTPRWHSLPSSASQPSLRETPPARHRKNGQKFLMILAARSAMLRLLYESTHVLWQLESQDSSLERVRLEFRTRYARAPSRAAWRSWCARTAEFCRDNPALSPQKQRLSVDAPTTKDFVAKNVFCQKTPEDAICGCRPSNFHDRRWS
jgi:hypothetical protein